MSGALAVAERVAPVPGRWTVVGCGVLAVVLLVLCSPIVGHLVTMAHEGGHALVAVLTGGEVHAVGVYADGTGETLYAGGGGILVTAAGYVGPSAVGLAGALGLARARPEAVLWGAVALLVLLMVVTGNWFGRLAVGTTAAGLAWVALRAPEGARAPVACTLVWLLLAGGVGHVLEHGRHGQDHLDLREDTLVPASVWAFLAAAAALGALVLGGAWMLDLADPPI